MYPASFADARPVVDHGAGPDPAVVADHHVAGDIGERFHREMCIRDSRKPYLNPEFKITDMARDLVSNRTYISAFINREYGRCV